MQVTAPRHRRVGPVNWIGFWTLYHKEVWRFAKVATQTVIAPVVTSLLFLAIFSLALGRSVQEIGGVTFTEAEVGTLKGTAELGSSAPYLGLGWAWGLADGGLAFSLDLGVLFQDSPDIELSSTGGTLSDEDALQDALADEEAQLEDDLDQYDLYPVVSLGVLYRF